MKVFLVSLFFIAAFSACHRKSVPSGGTDNNSGTNNSSTTINTPKTTNTTSTSKALIVVDSKGNLATDKQTLLANGAKSGYPATGARAFSPQERANLLARFKTVPPRVMHVPDSLSKKSGQGQYYVLREKFWYWKKPDGFYYLDENYYK